MSQASAVGQVIFKRQSGVYMPMLVSDRGDLYQEYDGDVNNPVNPSPNFEFVKPVLSYVITSSRVAEGIVTPDSVKWYFNGTLLTFSGNKSTNTFGGETGHFELLNYNPPVQNYYALRIVKNIVKAAGAAPCQIKAVATITVDSKYNKIDEIQYVYNIPIMYGVGNSKRVTIMSGDNKNFTITDKTDAVGVKLVAVARVGADEITSNLTYKWFKLVGGQWQQIGSATGKTLSVLPDMVDSAAQFKVEIMQGGDLIGMDVQTVVDATDPYDIIVNPTPANETISDQSDSVVYKPYLVKRGSLQKVKDCKFFFVFTDAVGIILNKGNSSTPLTECACTYDMCLQAGGNVSYTIMTEI